MVTYFNYIELSSFYKIVDRLRTSMQSRQWTTAEADAKKLWAQQINLITQEISAIVPENQNFILVDEDLVRSELNIENKRALPFFEHNGTYLGPPKDSEMAIKVLEFKRQKYNTNFIAFPGLHSGGLIIMAIFFTI